jgi:EAL domain-containing protein (putative c-di-GMP-specific phosphodiesterase class I)
MVIGALTSAGVPATALELEITETAVMQSPGASMGVLGELSSAHVRSSLDDFGTGYSSLAYLKRLPVHELKIDRSFISDLHSSRRDESIVNAIIDLSHGLGLIVVAEGIETAETFEALRDRGCDRGQGYQLQRPLPATEMTHWLREHRAPETIPAP